MVNEEDSDYDTLGLHWNDEPQEGGVLPNAEESIEGGVSAITTPEHYIPLAQIKVPQNNEVSITTTNPIIDSIIEEISSTHTTTCSTYEERIEIAKRYLQAGLKASSSGEFDTASSCFTAGRVQLGSKGWECEYSTMLKLCSEGANAAYVLGDFDKMNELIDEVLKQRISIEDKFRVYEIKMLALQAAGNNHESLELGIDIRRQLGFYTPPNKPVSVLMILLGYIITRIYIGKRTREELANLPELTNQRYIMAQRILVLIELDCYAVQPTLFPLINYLNVLATLQYGISPANACDAFGGFAILLCAAFGNPQRGRDMAEAVRLILAKTKPGELTHIISRTCLDQGFVYHWTTTTLQETLAPLLKGYQIGLDTGDVQSAGLNRLMHISHTYFAGRKLAEVDELTSANVGLQNETTAATRSSKIQKLDDSLTQSRILGSLIQVWYLVTAELRGRELDESELNFDGILKFANEIDNPALRSYASTGQLELKVIFSKWDKAIDILEQAGDVRANLLALFAGVRFTFLEALVLIKAARSSKTWYKRWKWKRRARKSINIIRRWMKRGNVNVIHYLHLLEAELAILNGNSNMAKDSYSLAIAVAEKNGLIQDQALIYELASAAGIDNRGDYNMKQAIKCYNEWGATKKVSQLKDSFLNK